jgi:glycosyltransferase involved in cell wall biosynthesis
VTNRQADMKREIPKVLKIASIDTTLVVLLWAQLRAMRVAGYDSRCGSQPGPNRDWLEAQGVTFVPMDIRRAITPWADLKALWKLYRYLRRERITIVHTHTPKAALLGQLAARAARVPVIINTLHGFYFHDDMNRLARWLHIAMAWIGGRCATMTLSQNPEDIDTAVRLRICRPDRIRFLGNGIDLNRFNPDRFDAMHRRKLRSELGISDDTVLIGMVGRLVVDKGYIELFEAARELKNRGRNFHLVIIGPEEKNRAGRIAADEYNKYGIADRVTYIGPRSDVEEWMACMDVFVLPSWREGFPRSAIEAAAMGLAIVTTDVRGCRQVVTDGENGLLVPAKSPDALANAMDTLISDADMRDRMGSAGRDRAKVEYNENTICDRVMKTYAEMCARRGVEPPEPQPTLDDDLPARAPFVW